MNCLDGGNGLTTGLELSLFSSGDEMEGSGEGGEVLDSGVCLGHEVFPVGNCDLGISQSEEDVSELDLFWILAFNR